MPVLVVGGHSRNVGKTSVVAGVIAAFRELHWTAMKITQYGHGICSANGEACDCATDDHVAAVSEERSRAGDTDTSRFLCAGADRVYWVRTQQGRLAEAMPRVRELIGSSTNTIIESNSVMKFIRPDLYLIVLDPANEDFKSSALEFLDRASAILLHESADMKWSNVSLKPVQNRPVFRVREGEYVSPELVEFVREKLTASPATS